MEFIYRCGVSENVGASIMLYAEFFAYYGNLLLPFVCAGSMPGLKTKIKKIFPYWRRRTQAVGPEVFIVAHRADDRQM